MTTSKKQTAAAVLSLVAAAFLISHFLFVLLPNVFEPWNSQVIDQLFIYRSGLERFRPAYDERVIHVDIRDQTIQELENFYLDRLHFAQAIRNLSDMRVGAQVWDIIFAARTQPVEDEAMIEATRNAGNVYYGLAFRLFRDEDGVVPPLQKESHLQYLDETKWRIRVEGDPSAIVRGGQPLLTFPDLARASKGLGSINIDSDRDGVVRRVPLLFRYDDAFYPSLSLRTVCDYLGVSPEHVVLKPGESIILKTPSRNLEIPIDDDGNMIVNFIGTWERMRHYEFAEVFRASEDREELELWGDEIGGKIVVVSEVMTGAADVGPVPTDTNFPLSGVHANAIHTILTANFLHEVRGLRMLGIELLLLGVVLVIALRLSSVPFSVATIVLLLGYLAASAILFLSGGVILNIVRPMLGVGIAFVSIMAYRYVNEEKQKEVLRRSFESYFPPSVVRRIMAHPDLITSSGHEKELTILFSDIKSFTTHSSTMEPDEIQRLLNEYFDAMVEIVFKYDGTVDKFIGDGLMVFFGDPEPQDDHALRCVRAAMEMQAKVRQLKEKWEAERRMPIQIRIGINTGKVVVGNMGSARRLSYTVLGAPVNLAQRLEASAPVGGILISARTNELVRPQVQTRSLGSIQVKGLTEGIPVYEVVME